MTKERVRRQGGDIDWVSASDIGKYVYCARLYWLAEIEGVRVNGEGKGRLAEGVRQHHRHGVRYDWQRRFRRAAFWLMAFGLVASAIMVMAGGGM